MGYASGMAHLYHQLGIAVQQFLKLPQAVKHQLLDLHATDTFQVAMGATSQQLVTGVRLQGFQEMPPFGIYIPNGAVSSCAITQLGHPRNSILFF